MRSALRALVGLNDVLEIVVKTLAGLLVAFMVLAVFGGAVTRYVTGIGYNVVMELPPMLMPWLIFPVAGILLRSGSHIAVDFLPERLSDRPSRVLRAIISLIAIWAGAVFCYAGYEATALFKLVGQRTEMEWAFPIWWIYLSFPVGFAILTSFALENLLKALVEDTDPDGPETHSPQAEI
ncbi:TRAP transporter small permease [Lutimaribacter sp. EGI FJ00015]|uniref:TRAP transporter small permease n=1 Tax=Lutimaribacter degradans TaxID=2945989 RepID=A0ACC5ZUZ0_9RHOB|nr:TRAP transporter small permease [Lutimaribacter sp. EGI FJ00013]MCM2561665.1 TRAP transporter small permease [Lutimaribacter sp. EGI FJ00013]MCO0612623.1 TRAP transporter small permease [Lutimaribacter sp. EGI FJ00015]MCO0635281.1 TRAP transporter small permease [Lutimaribacter sp. EGI FJ00014]